VVPSSPHSDGGVRHRTRRRARHRASEPGESFSRGFQALGYLARNGVQVSARAADLATGRELFSVDDYVVMPTASIGKVLLLVEVAARLRGPEMSALALLERDVTGPVGDSGTWQHLQVPTLPISDIAALIGSTSDNLATNVLLHSVGLDAVRARAEELGLSRSGLLDLVRDHRGPDDAPGLSVGSMKELTWLFSELARGEVVDAETSRRVVGWLSLNTDLSLVASAFGLDPLAHRETDHGLTLFNKTGADTGLRAEAGVLRGPRAGVAYAVAASYTDTDLQTRLAVIEAMRVIGSDLLEYVH
jgi:beta-lactamase class A